VGHPGSRRSRRELPGADHPIPQRVARPHREVGEGRRVVGSGPGGDGEVDRFRGLGGTARLDPELLDTVVVLLR